MTDIRHVVRRTTWIFALALAACTHSAWLSIDDGSTADHLSFRLVRDRSDTRALPRFGGIKVVGSDCSTGKLTPGNPYWFISATDGVGLQPAPTRIVYGDELPGFTVVSSVRHLKIGCYIAELETAGYSASVRFKIENDGAAKRYE